MRRVGGRSGWGGVVLLGTEVSVVLDEVVNIFGTHRWRVGFLLVERVQRQPCSFHLLRLHNIRLHNLLEQPVAFGSNKGFLESRYEPQCTERLFWVVCIGLGQIAGKIL